MLITLSDWAKAGKPTVLPEVRVNDIGQGVGDRRGIVGFSELPPQKVLDPEPRKQNDLEWQLHEKFGRFP